jgi:hypothetical protein
VGGHFYKKQHSATVKSASGYSHVALPKPGFALPHFAIVTLPAAISAVTKLE